MHRLQPRWLVLMSHVFISASCARMHFRYWWTQRRILKVNVRSFCPLQPRERQGAKWIWHLLLAFHLNTKVTHKTTHRPSATASNGAPLPRRLRSCECLLYRNPDDSAHHGQRRRGGDVTPQTQTCPGAASEEQPPPRRRLNPAAKSSIQGSALAR